MFERALAKTSIRSKTASFIFYSNQDTVLVWPSSNQAKPPVNYYPDIFKFDIFTYIRGDYKIKKKSNYNVTVISVGAVGIVAVKNLL